MIKLQNLAKVIWHRKPSKVHPRRKKINFKNIFKKKWIFLAIIFILGIIISSFILGGDSWKFQEVKYFGVKNLEKSQLNKYIDPYLGRNIFFVNPQKLADELNEHFIEISEARAEKVYRNKINFYIEEKIPHIIYLNFSGIFLFDTKGEVLKAWEAGSKVEFSELDYELARGFGDEDASYIEDRVYQDLDEEEIEDFIFEEMDSKEKQKVLNSIVVEKQTKFNKILDNNSKKLELFSEYQIPIIKAWDESVYKVGDFDDRKKIKFLGNAVNSLKERMNPKDIKCLWDGELRLICTIDQRIDLILSPSRKLNYQLQDLKLILEEIDKESEEIRMIDLTSEKVLVEYW
ncbi:FtsQ-type POTRA domain-containing protein [Candidatus Dojkabacteria bacterium]|nr:FtsQ-type POTRA domain-containing protein [Candidatus Dojkabacteria bacterium]